MTTTVTTDEYKALVRSRWTEAEFTRQVLQLAKLCGWRTAHFRPGRTKTGWRTAVQGDGVGFPDVLLLRGGSILVAELKVGSRKTTPAQNRWLQAFYAAGVTAVIWRPEYWDEIVKTLKGE